MSIAVVVGAFLLPGAAVGGVGEGDADRRLAIGLAGDDAFGGTVQGVVGACDAGASGIVDLAIAIIIFAVACFVGGSAWFGVAAGAGLCLIAYHLAGCLALAFAGCAGCPYIETIIDMSITIVVFPVADLGLCGRGA